ncbi:MAG: metal-dependent hydrolase, partial [Bacteroidetes bacterium]|nr:metal-dependent hydrolase [Bacteroidota bacterium]
MEDLSYPIGRFSSEPQLTEAKRIGLINDIADLPTHLREAINGLSKQQLEASYRPGGWTVRQVVHHGEPL